MSSPCAGVCPVCGRYFVKKLKTHMALHDNTRPFKCEYSCTELYFLTKGVQSTHYSEWHRAEHNNRQWTCPVCDVTIGGRQRLMHERKHIKVEKRRASFPKQRRTMEVNNNEEFAPQLSTPHSVEMAMPSSSESPSSDGPPFDGPPLEMPIPQPTCSFEETAMDAILSGAHHLVGGTIQAQMLSLPADTSIEQRQLLADIKEVNRLWSVISWRKADQEWHEASNKLNRLLFKRPKDFHKLRNTFIQNEMGVM